MSVIPWPLDPVRGGGRRSTGALKHAMIEHMPSADDTAGLAAALIQSRQTILPKRLGSPGPNVPELAAILRAAAHAPDHGQLTPWRFVLVPETSRTLLADVFAEALRERDPDAAPEQVEQAREKWHGNGQGFAEGEDPALRLVLRGRDPFADEATLLRFADATLAVFAAVIDGESYAGVDPAALKGLADAWDAEDAA